MGKEKVDITGWKAVSLDPADYTAGGLPGANGGFYATLVEEDFVLYDYNGHSAEYGWAIAARLKYLDDDGNEWVDHLPVGGVHAKKKQEITDTLRMALSLDGNSIHPDWPSDLDDLIGDQDAIDALASPFVISGGELGKNSKWEDWGLRVKEAEFPGPITSNIHCFHNIYGHWDRLPMERNPEKDNLVLTEFKSQKAGKGGAAAAKKAAPKASAKAAKVEEEEKDEAPEVDTDFQDKMSEFVLAQLEKLGDPLEWTKLKIAAIRNFKDDRKAVSDLLDEESEFLTANELWSWNAKKKTLSAS